MKITIYELLGMIKDGKAPKKIKIDNDILTLSKTIKTQYKFENFYGLLNWDYYIENYRLDEKIVEILDKDFKLEENKIPEKLDLEENNIPKKIETINSDFYVSDCYGENYERLSKEEIALDLVSLKNWINYIIDYLKIKENK